MNSRFIFTTNAAGEAMTGIEAGSRITVLDGNLLDALNKKVIVNDAEQPATEVFKDMTGKNERPFYIEALPLPEGAIDLQETVYLNPGQVSIRTGLIKLRLRISTEFASLHTNMGWNDGGDFEITLPEDIDMKDLQAYLQKFFDKIDFVPLYNTGGWEEAAELPKKNYKRFVGNVIKSFGEGWPRTFFHAHNPYFTATVELIPVLSKEIELIDTI